MRWARIALALAVGALVTAAAAASKPSGSLQIHFPVRPERVPAGIHKIRHIVIIMQENRSFDSYFGTFPGADGIPGLAGNGGRLPCLPDPRRGRLPVGLTEGWGARAPGCRRSWSGSGAAR